MEVILNKRDFQLSISEYPETDAEAIRISKHLCERIDESQFNNCGYTGIVEAPFSTKHYHLATSIGSSAPTIRGLYIPPLLGLSCFMMIITRSDSAIAKGLSQAEIDNMILEKAAWCRLKRVYAIEITMTTDRHHSMETLIDGLKLKDITLHNQGHSFIPIETVYVVDSRFIEWTPNRSCYSTETWLLFLHFPYSEGIEFNLHSSLHFNLYAENKYHDITLPWEESEHREYISRLDDDQPVYLVDITDHHKNLIYSDRFDK